MEWIILVTFPLEGGDISHLETNGVLIVTFPLQSGDTNHRKRNELFWWHVHYNLVTQAIENEMSHSGDNPFTLWWQRPIRNGMNHSGDIPIRRWWHKPFGNEWSTYGDIPITIWWHKPSKTEWVVLVTCPLQSGDTSHWKRNDPFWWHSHYYLVTKAIESEISHSVDIPITIWWQAIENEFSRSGDIPITIWWHKPLKTERVVLVTFPLQSGDSDKWERNESFWWYSHYNLVTQAIENEFSPSGDIPITIWWQKPWETEWVVLMTLPLLSGNTGHWKRNESF